MRGLERYLDVLNSSAEQCNVSTVSGLEVIKGAGQWPYSSRQFFHLASGSHHHNYIHLYTSKKVGLSARFSFKEHLSQFSNLAWVVRFCFVCDRSRNLVNSTGRKKPIRILKWAHVRYFYTDDQFAIHQSSRISINQIAPRTDSITSSRVINWHENLQLKRPIHTWGRNRTPLYILRACTSLRPDAH